MKKELVILSMSYYYNPSPVGIIAKQFSDYFKENYHVIVISGNPNSLKNSQIIKKEEKIYFIGSLSLYIREKCKNKCDFFHMLTLLLVRCVDFIKNILICNGSSRWFIKKTTKILNHIQKTRKIDKIISFSGNYATHLAAYYFKKKNKKVLWGTYTSDLSSSYPGNRFKKKSFMKIESMFFNNSDINFVTKEIKKWIITNKYKNIYEVPYLLSLNGKFNKKTLNVFPVLSYGGRFYSDIRNPRYMLEVFKQLSIDYVFDLYTEGECQNYIDLASHMNNRIKRHNMVSKGKLEEIYIESDFLVSLGNNIQSFQPSKIYEYISYGKPIIHFYFVDEDYFLNQYPYSLQIKIDTDLDTAKRQMETFIKKMTNIIIDKEYIKCIFRNNSEVNIRKIVTENMENCIIND